MLLTSQMQFKTDKDLIRHLTEKEIDGWGLIIWRDALHHYQIGKYKLIAHRNTRIHLYGLLKLKWQARKSTDKDAE